MSPSIITGWLFDIYPSSDGITLWLIDREGVKHRTFSPFIPSFFMHVPPEDENKVASLVQSFPFHITFERSRQREIYSNEEWNVLQVNVHDTLRFKQVVRRLERHFPHFVFFNSDIQTQQIYLYTTGLFPLAFGEYRIDKNGVLSDWHLNDSYDATDYTIPPLSILKLMNTKVDEPSRLHLSKISKDVPA